MNLTITPHYFRPRRAMALAGLGTAPGESTLGIKLITGGFLVAFAGLLWVGWSTRSIRIGRDKQPRRARA